MGNEEQVRTDKFSKRFHRFFYERSHVSDIGFTTSEKELLGMYLDHERLNNSLEILPRARDGSYYHEHLKFFSEISRIVKQAQHYRKTGELPDNPDYIPGMDDNEMRKEISRIQRERRGEPPDNSDETALVTDIVHSKAVNQYARDPNTGKEIHEMPTARHKSDTSLVQPYYRVEFKTNKKPVLQHSNELSLEELRKIKDELKKNPKTYVSKAAKAADFNKRARRSFK